MSWIGGLCPRCGEPGTPHPGAATFWCKPCKNKADRENKRRKRIEKKSETDGQAKRTNSYIHNKRKIGVPITLEWMISSRGERNEKGCWLWLGMCTEDGYGRIEIEGKSRRAHLLACELVGRPAPPGLEGDHRCRVRNCFNPDHIEYVTKKVNTQRGEVVKFIRGLCPRCGEPGDLRANAWGLRCRSCKSRYDWERRQRKRDEKT